MIERASSVDIGGPTTGVCVSPATAFIAWKSSEAGSGLGWSPGTPTRRMKVRKEFGVMCLQQHRLHVTDVAQRMGHAPVSPQERPGPPAETCPGIPRTIVRMLPGSER